MRQSPFAAVAPPSFRHDLQLVLPALSPALLAPGERPALLALAGRLPPLDGGFELRLHDPAAQVELSASAWPQVPADLDRLAAGPAGWPDPGLLASPIWRDAVAVARRLAAEEDRRHTALWLEFDRPSITAALPEPCLFLSTLVPRMRDLAGLVAREHARLCGAPPHPEVLAALTRLGPLLPEGTLFQNIGILHGREGTPIRVRLENCPMDRFAEAAAQIWGVEGAAPLRRILERHPMPGIATTATLDLRAGRPPRFGLPIYAPVGPSRAAPELAHLERVLGALVAHGLCTPAAAAALPTWPGHVPLPATAQGRPVVLRILMQLKLAFNAQGGVEAKAYVGLLRRVVAA